eukprot:349874_1
MSVVKEGWIEKKGQTFMAGYKKRWMVLYNDKTLKYYEDNYYEILKGSIDVSEAKQVQNSREHSKNWRFGWEIITPTRNWYFSSRSENDRKQWMATLTSIIENEVKAPRRISYNKHKRLKNIAKEQNKQNDTQLATTQPLITNEFDTNTNIKLDNDEFGNDNKLNIHLNIAKDNTNINAIRTTNITDEYTPEYTPTETVTKSKFGKDYTRITSKSVTEKVNKQMINLSINKQIENKQEPESAETFCVSTKIDEITSKGECVNDDIENCSDLKCFCGGKLNKKVVENNSINILCEFCGNHKLPTGSQYYECDEGNNEIHGNKTWQVCACCCYHALVRKYYNPLVDKCPRRIGISITIERISNICTSNQAFRAKLQIKHSWKPTREEVQLFKDKPTDFQPFWRPRFDFPNLIEVHDCGLKLTHWSTEYTILKKGESNSGTINTLPYLITGIYWIDATFSEVFELEHFPVDCQDLTIKIQLQQFVTICEFTTPFQGSDVLTLCAEYATISEWNVHSPKLEIIKQCHGIVVKYSRINLSIKLERIPAAYFWRMVLFLAFLTAASLISFCIDALDDGPDRIAYLITLLLTAVAYQFAILQDLPKVSYLTLMDKYILQTFFFIFGMLIETAIVMQNELDMVDVYCNYFFWVIFICVQLYFIVLTMKARKYELGKLTQNVSDMDDYCNKKRHAKKLVKIRKFGSGMRNLL